MTLSMRVSNAFSCARNSPQSESVREAYPKHGLTADDHDEDKNGKSFVRDYCDFIHRQETSRGDGGKSSSRKILQDS